MKKIRLIARIDINNEHVVKGKCLEGLRKLGSPNEFAEKYYKDGIDEIIFLDAVASLYERNSLIPILKKASKNIFIPITVGGGIRNIADIKDALSVGADRIAINSQAVIDIQFVKNAVEEFGSQAIVGSLVARTHRYSWEAFIDNAKHRTRINAIDWAKKLEQAGVGEIMVTSVDCDGCLNGFDVNLLREISRAVDIPVIASGGAGSRDHLLKLFSNTECDAVALGSVLHYKIETIKDLKKYLLSSKMDVRL